MTQTWYERELEDYIAAHPNVLSPFRMHLTDVVVLGRQVATQVGVIDLLCLLDTTICVVELKAKQATARDVDQVMRYASYLDRYKFDLLVEPNWRKVKMEPRVAHQMGRMIHDEGFMRVQPMLVAPDFAASVERSPWVHLFQAMPVEDGFKLDDWLTKCPGSDKQLEASLKPAYDLLYRVASNIVDEWDEANALLGQGR